MVRHSVKSGPVAGKTVLSIRSLSGGGAVTPVRLAFQFAKKPPQP
jgi:hypothetical protein